MSRLAYRLCIAVNLGIGLAVYAYGFLSMPGGNASPVPQAKPQPAAAMKPTAPVAHHPATGSIKPSKDTITGAINPSRDAVTEPINPQAIRTQAAKIPGVRLAALGPHALPAPVREQWTPAVGYNSVVVPPKRATPPAVRRPRAVRAYRPYRPYYYARPSFSFGIGIPLRW